MINSLPISEASNLAIHALAAIHNLGAGKRLSVAQIAKVLDVSQSHLAKVMQKLVKAGFVDSTRGANGGFILAKSAKSISLFAVVKVIDAELKVQHCLFEEPRCTEENCVIAQLQQEIGAVVVKRLKEAKIADIKVTFKREELLH